MPEHYRITGTSDAPHPIRRISPDITDYEQAFTGAVLDALPRGTAPRTERPPGNPAQGSVRDRHPQRQGADPFARVLRPEIGVADHARGMEVAQRYRAP